MKNNNLQNNKDTFYSSKILFDGVNSIILEFDEILNNNMYKEYFNSIILFKNTINELGLQNKIKVEEIINNELRETIDYTIIVKEDKKDKITNLTSIINKFIDFQYEIMKDCLFVLKAFSLINISLYNKNKSDFKFKLMSINNAINLSNINIMGYIEYIDEVNNKKFIENNVLEIMNSFSDLYSLYK